MASTFDSILAAIFAGLLVFALAASLLVFGFIGAKMAWSGMFPRRPPRQGWIVIGAVTDKYREEHGANLDVEGRYIVSTVAYRYQAGGEPQEGTFSYRSRAIGGRLTLDALYDAYEVGASTQVIVDARRPERSRLINAPAADAQTQDVAGRVFRTVGGLLLFFACLTPFAVIRLTHDSEDWLGEGVMLMLSALLVIFNLGLFSYGGALLIYNSLYVAPSCVSATRGVRVDGVVTQFIPGKPGPNGEAASVVCRYEVDGDSYQRRFFKTAWPSDASLWKGLQVGSPAPLLADPDHPERARLTTGAPQLLSHSSLVVSLFKLAAGCLLLAPLFFFATLLLKSDGRISRWLEALLASGAGVL